MKRVLRCALALGGCLLGAAALHGLVIARATQPIQTVAPRTTNAPDVEPATPSANPSVAPGKIRWHASLDKALAAAEKSHKPVMVFHMMGQLDQQFC